VRQAELIGTANVPPCERKIYIRHRAFWGGFKKVPTTRNLDKATEYFKKNLINVDSVVHFEVEAVSSGILLRSLHVSLFKGGRMKKTISSTLTCAAVLIMAASAVAGEREGAFSISPFAGGYTFGGVQHFETSPVYGLRLGFDLTKNWGLEAVGDYLATDGTLNDRSVNTLSYRLDILYNFMADGPVVPYIAVGGGGITYGHGSDGLKISDRTTDATVNAGLGLKLFLTDSIALRGDARQLFVLEQPNSPKYNWEYTAGLTFLFGGKTAPVPEPVPSPLAPSDNLTVVPSSITKGQSATLTWSSQNTTTCEIQPEIGLVQPQGSMTITPADNTSYILSCVGAGGSAKSAANVSVSASAPLVPFDNLTVVPSSITKGQSATLTWSSQNATTCEIQPEIGLVQQQGSMTISPSDNATYTLSCVGAGGSAKSAANLSVIALSPLAPTDNLTVVPSSVTKGQSATLTWRSQNATTCEIQPEIGLVQPQGTMTITPADNTAYTLSCVGSGGTAKSAANISVIIPAPPAPVAKLCSPAVIDIHFDTNKSDVKPQYHDELKKMADFLNEFPNATGVIEGHTDNVGTKAANMKLSQRRANNIRNYLVDKFGIAPERIKAIGYGPTKPIASNKTKAGREQNRRIESNFTCNTK
jgi:OOP family OmpA-OmpF porin